MKTIKVRNDATEQWQDVLVNDINAIIHKDAELEELTVEDNGTYLPEQVDGFNKVIVDVQPTMVELNVSANGEYTPEEGIDGFDAVVVDVQPDLEDIEITENGTYHSELDGFGEVVVNVEGGGGHKEYTGYDVSEMQSLYSTITEFDDNGEVDNLYTYTFTNWPNLEMVSMRNVKTVYSSAIMYCPNLKSIYLNNVESIFSSAFAGCYSLTTISLPKLKVVNNGAFSDCGASNLSSIYMPNVELISNYGFYAGPHITELTNLPKLSQIGMNAFGQYNSYIERIDLQNVSSIGESAFCYNNNLSYVSMPNVGTIGRYAFQLCSNLTELYIPNVRLVSDYAFTKIGISKLELNNVYNVSQRAFASCVNLKEIKLKYQGGSGTINSSAFMDCSNLEKVETDGIGYFSAYAFSNCVKLSEIKINIPITSSEATLTAGTLQGDFVNNCQNLMSVYIGYEDNAPTTYMRMYSSTFNSTPIGGYWGPSYTGPVGQYGSIYVPSETLPIYRKFCSWYADRFVGY